MDEVERTMRTLRFEAYGSPVSLRLEETPLPTLQPGQALVEVRAAAISPSDVKNLAGAFHASLPGVPGRDYAGVVVAGDGPIGQEVWGSGPGFGVSRPGAHAEYVVVPTDWLSLKPTGLSFEEAAAVGVPYVTAWSAVVVAADIQPGETILITGGAGAVGRAASQIARWKGARVIAADRVKTSSGDVFIDLTRRDLPSSVLEATGGLGADLALDTVGGPLFEPALKSLRVGGRQVAITSVGKPRVEFDLTDFYHGRLRLIGLDTMKLTGAEIAAIMDEVRGGFDGGHLTTSEVAPWPLERAFEAFETVAQGNSPHVRQILVPALRPNQFPRTANPQTR